MLLFGMCPQGPCTHIVYTLALRTPYVGTLGPVVKIMVPFWVPIIIRHHYLGYPKRDHNFDNYPYAIWVHGPLGAYSIRDFKL